MDLKFTTAGDYMADSIENTTSVSVTRNYSASQDLEIPQSVLDRMTDCFVRWDTLYIIVEDGETLEYELQTIDTIELERPLQTTLAQGEKIIQEF
jgi:hypothetical protein